MLLHFYKMTGAGNDFVMVDNRDLELSSVLDKETIEAPVSYTHLTLPTTERV